MITEQDKLQVEHLLLLLRKNIDETSRMLKKLEKERLDLLAEVKREKRQLNNLKANFWRQLQYNQFREIGSDENADMIKMKACVLFESEGVMHVGEEVICFIPEVNKQGYTGFYESIPNVKQYGKTKKQVVESLNKVLQTI